MGNCQAIDAATLVIQHPCGKVDKLYWPVPASEIMKTNPGHYVALLITTTICHSSTTTKPQANLSNNTKTNNNNNNNNNNNGGNNQKNNNNKSKGSPDNKSSSSSSSTSSASTNRNSVRITRVKLLRPTDTLALGHVYRLISTQEVMKGLVAKKQAKMRKNGIELADSEALKEAEKFARKSQQEKTPHQVSRHGHGHRSRTTTSTNSNGGTAKPRTWQPSLHSISEATI